MPPTHRPTPPLPSIVDRLTTPRWVPILLFWVVVIIGLGVTRIVF
jgi:hypothetical protein